MPSAGRAWAQRPVAATKPGALLRAAAQAFADERARWPLWLPVALACGIGLYFALPLEPPPWAGAAAAGAAGAIAFVAWRRAQGATPFLALGATVLLAAAIGFSIAQLRTAMVAAPVLAERWGPGEVRGRIRLVEPQPGGARVVLDRVTLSRHDPAETPARIRVRLAGEKDLLRLRPGSELRALAILLPPPAPAAPGAFDFQRLAWFQELGAVGFALGRADVRGPSEPGASLALWLARVRQEMGARIRAAVPGPTGEVAAGLLIGDRGAIPDDLMAAMRDSGLAHLLAISGMNVGIVAGFVLFTLRLGLALVPGLALRRPIKKWAAAAGLFAAMIYLLLAGATVPTQRAFLMIGLVSFALLVDRSALSMRNVAWAAAAILLLAPESLLGASFQMSFAAVVALIATYEAFGGPLVRWSRGDGVGWLRRLAGYLAAVVVTTVVAGLATAIPAIYHFNRMAMYGLAANMVAVPVTALWVMPWGLVALLLYPFGLEALGLVPMSWGVDVVLATARTVAGWSGAVAVLPAMPGWGLVLAAMGGLWLCLWRGRWRVLGIGGLMIGAVVGLALSRPPDIIVTGDGRLVAAQAADGRYMLSSRRVARFAADSWLRRAGESAAAPWPAGGASADGRLACDAAACLYRAAGKVVALVRDERALAEECLSADAVVSLEPVRVPCAGPRLVVDRFDLWRHGAHALWLRENGIRVESVNGARGDRPWVLGRGAGGDG